ncbi:MAG TPA: ABC transporter ATP-binding protein, partial [Bryobacteraceae bacterium]|nr:ABC transporter ATP-binding protein [Bryobacteraceae bacterium]
MNEYLWPKSSFDEALRALGGSDVDIQPVETPYPDLESQLPNMGPAVIDMGSGYLALSRARILTPTGKRVGMNASAIRAELCADIEAPVVQQIDALLTRAKIPSTERIRNALLREQLSSKLIRGIWLVRLPPSANFWQQLKQVRVPQRLAALGAAHSIQYILWILAWWVVGANVLQGSADQSWLWLWALLLITIVPLRVLITWLQGRIAISTGARLKQRLFAGALSLDPDSIRHQGAGQLLGRVIETEAVESLALSGGFLGLVAGIELVISIFVLAKGAGGALQSTLLVVWLAVTAAIAWRYYNRNRAWTTDRLNMTHDLVESMVGHRTRLAQLPPDRWHDGEDEALARYLESSKSMDSSTTALLAIVPRGWLVIGLVALIPAFAAGANSPSKIAIAVGGMLLAFRAFKRLAAGAWQIAGAAVAWQRVTVLFHATKPNRDRKGASAAPGSLLVDAEDLVFRYNDRTAPVLSGATFQIASGDRLVLEGPSGGGKSTLVAILAGLREPNSGRLLMNGVDRRTAGADAWRTFIAAAPQFHENHVLAETFAFNLFMGRRGFIGPRELAEAEEICAELGLGELL